MDDMELEHRLTKLESRVGTLEELIHESKADRFSLHDKIDSVRSVLDKQKTFVGGIIFTFGCVWALLAFAKDWLFNHLK